MVLPAHTIDAGAEVRTSVQDALTWLVISAYRTASALEDHRPVRGDIVRDQVAEADFQAQVTDALRTGREFMLDLDDSENACVYQFHIRRLSPQPAKEPTPPPRKIMEKQLTPAQKPVLEAKDTIIQRYRKTGEQIKTIATA